MEHSDKAAVVTGGGGGIGRAIALALAEQGARVALADLDLAAATRVADEVNSLGGEALAVETNVADKSSVESMGERVVDSFGGIDILVNGAGLQYVAPFVDFPESAWDRLIGVMLSGTFFCTQVALRSMVPRQRGRIINISSTYGRIGAAYKAAYVAAKHGIIGLTRVAALETAELGITVNAICPGVTGTSIVEDQLESLAEAHGTSREDVLEKVLFPVIPQKRILDPREIADSVLFLASGKARAITGQAINVSAGWVMQ